MIAGVCGGIAAAFPGALVYVLLWLIVPRKPSF